MSNAVQTHPILVLLPRLSDGRIILINRSGYWELPSCRWAPEGDLSSAAAALLQRMTDYTPGRLCWLGQLPGGDCYLVDEVRPSPLPPFHAGQAITTAVSAGELQEMARLGLIRSTDLALALTLLQQFVK